jgi:hypothetical protein
MPAELGQVLATLIGNVIVISPIVLGWAVIRMFPRLFLFIPCALAALALTLAGAALVTLGRAIGTGDSGPRVGGGGYIITGYLCSFVGLLLAFGASGGALTHAQRNGRRRWVKRLLVGALLPLLVTLGLFDFYALVILSFYGGEQAAFTTELLLLWLAPVGCVLPIIYGLFASRSPVQGQVTT